MKVLFIGGTGTISMAISKKLAEDGCELYLLNRGNRNEQLSDKVIELQADINNEDEVRGHLTIDKEFLGLKYWIVKNNPTLYDKFSTDIIWNKK